RALMRPLPGNNFRCNRTREEAAVSIGTKVIRTAAIHSEKVLFPGVSGSRITPGGAAGGESGRLTANSGVVAKNASAGN
ncbi:hypothetical protein CCH79_00005489, partial [Gambusia affinis]